MVHTSDILRNRPLGASDMKLESMASAILITLVIKYSKNNLYGKPITLRILLVLLAYNSSLHDSTSLSPAMMTYARYLDRPADMFFEGPEHASKQASPPSEYAQNLAEQMEKVNKLARDNLAKSNDAQRPRYDLKQYKRNYKVGDLVLLFTPVVKQGNCRKLSSLWTGPYTITDILSDVILHIKMNNLSHHKVVHHNHLKPYYAYYLYALSHG